MVVYAHVSAGLRAGRSSSLRHVVVAGAQAHAGQGFVTCIVVRLTQKQAVCFGVLRSEQMSAASHIMASSMSWMMPRAIHIMSIVDIMKLTMPRSNSVSSVAGPHSHVLQKVVPTSYTAVPADLVRAMPRGARPPSRQV